MKYKPLMIIQNSPFKVFFILGKCTINQLSYILLKLQLLAIM
jgi:hypothetical protein